MGEQVTAEKVVKWHRHQWTAWVDWASGEIKTKNVFGLEGSSPVLIQERRCVKCNAAERREVRLND